ncbi:MAG: hypothetical protein M1404_03885 [Acidobacteria bacterium]|nr:hypothetical protein [Acidobacteriota bacterium]
MALGLLVSLAAAGFQGPQQRSRPILNPANIPPWFQTGMFRSARWDGGPIEAEKGELTGWPNFTPDSPLHVLQATRNWYNLKTIRFLKIAHINWAWVTWSNGFSPVTEEKQWRLLRAYIKACHENNIRVAAYFSIGNMFWEDMFEHLPQSIAWVKRMPDGSPWFYSRPNRYMADITNPGWVALQKERVTAAARAGVDAFWIDNAFSYYGEQNVGNFIDAIYAVVSKINPHIVIMSNYNRSIYTWARLQNGVTTEDGREPGYYTDRATPYIVTNAGLLRYNYAIGEGWRPVSVEDGQRHVGTREATLMASRKWQLAIAECAMYHTSLEIFVEGLFLRDLYFHDPVALRQLRAIGVYNGFLERNEKYYTKPESLAEVAILSDTTDSIVPALNRLSLQHLDYDVLFNYQRPHQSVLDHYKVIVAPNTNPLSEAWDTALSRWVKEKGGTLVAVQDASLFRPGPAGGDQDFGLGDLLGITKRAIPREMQVRRQGKGLAIYLPKLPTAAEMAALIRQHMTKEAVEVEPRPTVFSNVAYQAKDRRIVLHLLNYKQDLQQDIHVRVRFAVRRVEILSPDALSRSQAVVRSMAGGAEIIVPELHTYDLVVIYPGEDVSISSIPRYSGVCGEESDPSCMDSRRRLHAP